MARLFVFLLLSCLAAVCLSSLESPVLNVTSCTDSSTSLSCLRALPYETYYSALLNSSYNPAPIPDGDFILQSPINAIKQGKVVNKNVLISATRDEATCESGNLGDGRGCS